MRRLALFNKLINLGTIHWWTSFPMMIQWGPYWSGNSSLKDRMISQVTSLWGLFEEDYHHNIPKKDSLNLLVNLVSWGTFEDILTNLTGVCTVWGVWSWCVPVCLTHHSILQYEGQWRLPRPQCKLTTVWGVSAYAWPSLHNTRGIHCSMTGSGGHLGLNVNSPQYEGYQRMPDPVHQPADSSRFPQPRQSCRSFSLHEPESLGMAHYFSLGL